MSDLKDMSTEALLAELAGRQGGDVGTIDSMESAIESVGDALKAKQMEMWLERMSAAEDDSSKPCPRCGRRSAVRAKGRSRQLRTLRGVMSYKRNYHFCEHCKAGYYPLDTEVGSPREGEYTELLRRRALDFAVNAPFEEASERIAMHYGVSVSTHALRCMVERLPMPSFSCAEGIETQERVTVQVDGSMVPTTKSWKEAKLGVVWSESEHKQGSKDKDRGEVTKASYVATLGNAKEFSSHLQSVLPRRIGFKERNAGDTEGPEVVWVGDGAAWIWRIQQQACPQAVQVLDWYHAVSHGVQCGKEVLAEDLTLCALWDRRIKQLLWNGDIDTLLKELAECALFAETKTASEELRKLRGYYKTNKKRMNYQEHRDAGRVIGSGVVESSHRHVLQTRMKRAGQHWSPKGAEKMARLRAVYKTRSPSDFYGSVMKSAA